METLQSSLLPSSEYVRQNADYHPSVWGDYFFSCDPISPIEQASLTTRINEHKVEIIQMFNNTTNSLQTIELIDTIQRLGVGYHFEKQINEALCNLFKSTYDENDLYIVSLLFRLLRQQRYYIPSDIFNKFLDENGEFKDCFSSNPKALLSLYEAAHLVMPGEEILDKAISFSKTHLMLMKSELEPYFSLLVSISIEIPLFRRTDRIKTKRYLSTYEQDPNFNEVLLEFAKLDFICLQAMYQEEAQILSMWWKSIGLAEGLPFARDRLIECYFWVLSTYSEPCYSRARIMTTKCTILISILDDIYDVYGTLEELHLLTNAIERWEIEGVENLPEYMQLYFFTVINTFKEFETELDHEQNTFRLKYAKDQLKKLANAYHQEAIWANRHYVPKLDEHLSVTLTSVGYHFLTSMSYVGMEEVVSKEVFEWAASAPDIMKASSLIGRLLNDIFSYEDEQKRNHVASSVQCYAMENECSEKEACQKLFEMSNDAWKVINKDLVMNTKIPLSFIMPIINLARSIEFIYLGKDQYTNSDQNMKQIISSVLVEPIQICNLKG